MERDIAAFIAFVNARHDAPYAWGSAANDCISFCDGAVKALTGRSAMRGRKWSNKAGALRVLKAEGGMEAALDARFERVPVSLAKRGDIAGVPASAMTGVDADELALIGLHPMIVEGALLVAPGDRGLKRAPRALATVAWNITSLKRPPAPPHTNPGARGRHRQTHV